MNPITSVPELKDFLIEIKSDLIFFFFFPVCVCVLGFYRCSQTCKFFLSHNLAD